MPSATTSLRRQREIDSDGLLDSSGAGSTPSSSNKRARLSVNGHASPSSQRTPSSNSYASARSTTSQSETLHARSSRRKHQPGSIVRVKLENFVTYTAVEFSPGPSLNMVIGPNGTGKSTLVCAICLGLGWGAQHLGRAKDVSEFVKNGCQEALIEIELAADGKFKSNPIVQCRITQEGNKCAFSINGKPASKKNVLELVRHFSIQIDNLCQFLPQDKVVEFAAMTPVELLRSTQRAVAPQEMIDMHENLKELGKQKNIVEDENHSNQETLTNLEDRQRMQQADVERMRERNEIQQRIENLEKARPIWQYRDARTLHREAKAKKDEASKELADLEAEVEPSLRAVNAKQIYLGQIEKVIKERGQAVKQAERAADSIDGKLRDLHERQKDLENEAKAEGESGKKMKSDISRIEGNSARLKKQMEEPPPDLDVSAYNEQIREKSRAIDDLRQRSLDVKAKQADLTRAGRDKNQRIAQAERELHDLESQAGQMNKKLANLAPETWTAWQWIQDNQNLFEKHVFGPVMLECSITEPKWVDQVESLFQISNFTCFTVQTRNDFATLNNKLHGELKLGNLNMRTMDGKLDNFRSSVSREDLKRYGLDGGYALDCLTGPEPVLAMLAYELKLHTAALGNRDTTPQEYDMLINSPIDQWITSKSTYRIIRRREYGPSATSAQVREIRKGTVWTDQPVDIGAKRDLQENIEGWGQEVQSYEQEIRDLQAQLVRLREQIEDKAAEIKTMTEEKSVRQKAMSEFKALPVKLAQLEEKLSSLHESVKGARDRVQAIHDKADSNTLERGEAALDYASAVERLRQAHNDLYTAEVMQIEASSEVQTLIERNSSVKLLLDNKRKEVEELQRTTQKARDDARRILAVCQQLVASEDAAFNAFLNSIPTEAPGQQMEDEISSEKARLELMHEGNGGVIKEYEQRQRKVESLKAKAEECKHALDELQDKIKEIREHWEPELDKLVEKISRSFSYNMGQINCAGEVGIFKDEQDFDEWAIQIRVKFRENEPLTILDSHRQSGGERAVSTIFYLMSLQSLTRSPFRVVDEINQGMDPRNERLVHKRMVNIACGTGDPEGDEFAARGIDGDVDADGGNGGGSQYFLITPKLLHGLEYARGMRVLCIASGEYMPQEKSKIDFGKCVEIARRLKGLRSGARGIAAAG